jgi:hypothetical protein
MCAMKSVLDIEVNDAQFKAYTAAYAKYEAALGKQAEMWKKAGMEQGKIGAHFQKMTAQLMAQSHANREAGEAGKKQLVNLRQSDQLWTSMSRNTRDVSKNILGATTSLLRWTGILSAVSGLFGAGGLYGIDRMAAGVSGQRQSAMGRGVSLGEQSAFRNFDRLFGGDATSFLDTTSGMLTDPRKSWSLATMGVNANGSTEETAVNLLKAMRQRARGTDTSQLGMLDTQTGIGAGADVWRRLHDMGDPEFSKMMAANQRDIKSLGVGDKTAEAWVDFNRQMQRAGQQIENVFVNGLTKLAGPLGNLSAAFVHLVKDVMGSDMLKDGIKSLAHWLDDFSKEMESGQFQRNVKDLIDGVGGLADQLRPWAHPLDALMASAPSPLKSLLGVKGADVPKGQMPWSRPETRPSWLHPQSDDARLGLPDGTLRKLAGPDMGDPELFGGEGYNGKVKGIADELRALERQNRSWSDTDNTAATQKALMQYGAAHNIQVTINNNTGGSAIAVVNQQHLSPRPRNSLNDETAVCQQSGHDARVQHHQCRDELVRDGRVWVLIPKPTVKHRNVRFRFPRHADEGRCAEHV